MDYHTSWKIIEEKYCKIILTKKLEFHIIELPKIVGISNDGDALLDWLSFLDNPKSERVMKKMEENKELKKANEKLQTLSEDEKLQRLAEWREKAIYEYNTATNNGFKNGMKHGLEEGLEQGIKQGINQGIEQGLEQGIKKGSLEKAKEIAKNLLKKGFDLELIEQTTGLSLKEIIALKKGLVSSN